MAAPADKTSLDYSGTWRMNKTLSDDSDEILRLQGVDWKRRMVISYATITLKVKHYKDENGVERIDIDQTLTGGIPGARIRTSEYRTLDWTERPNEDGIFGPVLAKSRRTTIDQIENEHLKNGWIPESLEHGVVQAEAASDTPKSKRTWFASQVWGFETVNAERRYTRHVHFTTKSGNPKETIDVRLVYDFVSA